MNSVNQNSEDWFDWARSHLDEWDKRDAEWQRIISPQTQKVLRYAQGAALSLGHNAVGAEHLLAGILKLNKGPVIVSLENAGITLERLKGEVVAAWGPRRKEPTPGSIPYTPRCKGIIQRAMTGARLRENGQVEPEHLLGELLSETDGLPAKLFRKHAIDVAQIKSIIESSVREIP